MKLKIWINGVVVSNLHISSPNTFKNGGLYFYAQVETNQICFN